MARTWRTGLAAVAAAVLLAGCGSSGNDFASKDPKDIVKAASADMKGLTSLRMQGDLTTEGQKVGLDMQVTTKGDCQGTLTVAQGTAQIVSSGGQAYMKPDKAFWESQAPGQAAQIEAVVGDKWVAIPSSSGLDSACDLSQLLSKFNDTASTPGDAPTSASPDSVGGKDAVKLSGQDKDGNPMVAWVATDSPHYVLKIQATDGTSPGTVTFSEFDQSFSIQPPAADQVVDLSKLGG